MQPRAVLLLATVLVVAPSWAVSSGPSQAVVADIREKLHILDDELEEVKDYLQKDYGYDVKDESYEGSVAELPNSRRARM